MKKIKLTVNKEIIKILLTLSLPMMLQNLITSSLNIVDTMMVGMLGGTELAAVGLANNLYFVLMLVCFGTYSGSSIFTSQYYGKRDFVSLRKSVNLSLLIGLGFSLIFTFIGFLFPTLFLSLFISDPEVIKVGSSYLKIVSLSYILMSISFAFSFAIRCTGNTRTPLIISTIGFSTNTLLNYLLIFGSFGFPKLGVEGAAIATVVARLIEVVLVLYVIQTHEFLKFKISELFTISTDFVKMVLKTSLPVIGNEFGWALGMVMYSAAYAKISKDAVAAVQIASSMQMFYNVIFFGIGNALLILIGKELGANRLDKAKEIGNEVMKLSVYIAIFMSVFIVATNRPLLEFYKVSSDIKLNAMSLLLVFAFYNVFRVININMVVGVLRAGGDTVYSLVMELGSVWLVGVPLAFLTAVVFKWPVYYVYAAISLEEVFKAVIGINRFLSYKWLKNLVDND